MAKNILIITGSARKGGNTDLLAEAFLRGAKEAGHEVHKFESAVDTVEGCLACDTCWGKDKPCSFDDGFDKLSPMLEKADLLVLCSPLYWYTLSAQIKAAIDKFYSYMVAKSPTKLKFKETMLLMCAEDDTPGAFDGAVGTYKAIGAYLNVADRGMLLIPGVHAKGDIHQTDALVRAEKMGAEI